MRREKSDGMIKDRKRGHKALRLRDGKLESFDPHPKSNYKRIAIQELDKRGAIHWGLATSLKYEETLEYIEFLLQKGVGTMGQVAQYKDLNIQETKIRLQLLLEEWDLYRTPKMVLKDILDSWPEVCNEKNA